MRPIVILALSGLALTGCAESRLGKSLPEDGFQFPTGLAVHPAGFALVASSNFDVGYSGGALRVLDLNVLAAEMASPVEQRTDYPYYRNTFVSGQGIGLDNFAGTVAVSNDGRLAAVAVRETDELVLVDLEVRVEDDQAFLILSCWPGQQRPAEDFPACSGGRNRIELTEMDPYDVIFLPASAESDDQHQTAWISSLRSGDVQALEIPFDRQEVPRQNLSITTEVAGASDLAFAPGNGLIYVTSRFPTQRSNPVSFFDPGLGADATVEKVDFFNRLLGRETRSIAFASDGITAGLVVRTPNMLVLLDTSTDYTGAPTNRYLGSIALSSNPSRIRSLGDKFFVSGAKDDTIVVVDSRSRRVVASREDVCRGPFEMAFWERGDLRWCLVSCFEDDTVAVLDVNEDSPDYLEVIARVGVPRDQE
jgi:DNA-binding beta-propeller fold protein YncE